MKLPVTTATPDQPREHETRTPVRRSVTVVHRPACLLCDRQGGVLYTKVVDWLFDVPGEWGIRYCAACDIGWLDPQPIADEVATLYSQYCTHSASGSTTWIGRTQEEMTEAALARLGYPVESPKRLLPRLLSWLPSAKRSAILKVFDLRPSDGSSLLDVGCGNGQFISRMRLFGWKASGIDPDPAAVALGQKQGLDVHLGLLSELPEIASYDVITMSHVIEHTDDPVALLRECVKRLRPGGRLLITTPNLRSLGHRIFKAYWRGLEVPRHFVLLSPAALRLCVQRAGLQLQFLRTETRLCSMIYLQSSCARAYQKRIAERPRFTMASKLAARVFRVLEDMIVRFQQDAGEEIFCACLRPAE